MEMKDIVLSKFTKELLVQNGKMDRKRGINPYDGWREICNEMGFSLGRTPAQEAYLDGFYSPV